MTMLLAGHETTATALAFAFGLLARHPAVLARLRDELGDDDDTHLDAVVTETLRLRPAIDANERTLTVARTVGGWDLPAGILGASSWRRRGRSPTRSRCAGSRAPWRHGAPVVVRRVAAPRGPMHQFSILWRECLGDRT